MLLGGGKGCPGLETGCRLEKAAGWLDPPVVGFPWAQPTLRNTTSPPAQARDNLLLEASHGPHQRGMPVRGCVAPNHGRRGPSSAAGGGGGNT